MTLNRRSLFGAVGAVIFSASMHWSGAQVVLDPLLVAAEPTGSGWTFDGFDDLMRGVDLSGDYWADIPNMRYPCPAS